MKNLSWEFIQSFAEVAKFGSLSKAAIALNTSQPTLSRQMSALEKNIGITLFDRSTQGLKITKAGSRLIESCEAMQRNAEHFSRIAASSTLSLAGNIRISANEVIGLYYLPEIIAKFNQQYPEVTVEIEISNQQTSLSKREADIALRMFRPTQTNLIAKRLPDIKLNFVASKTYLLNNAEPKTLQEAFEHNLIGYDHDLQFLKAVKQLGWPIVEENIRNKTDFLPLQIELARKGGGITVTHNNLLKQFPELQIILAGTEIPSLEFWLVCHADVQHNQRIRVMMDFLTLHLRDEIQK
ncbi:MAG: LysR family transcriptional regulator [Alteromonadaceae bacterium]|nr:LysR family transcriptional regulator [Alteromonadaceae bacterium]